MERSDTNDGDIQEVTYLQNDESHSIDDPTSDGECMLHIGEALGGNEQEMNHNQEKKEEATAEFGGQSSMAVEIKEFDAPAIGMEFESYDDAYNYYNCYAKEVGFHVRVKNSWFKRNSKEKYGAVLCCSSQGFKRIKDVNRLRKETRTGCPAMIRMRLVDSKRWRVLEVNLEHNHMLGYKMYSSSKKMVTESKRKTIKLYRTLIVDAGDDNNANPKSNPIRFQGLSGSSVSLNLRRGDSAAIYNYFCRMQLMNPNFFYLTDLNDEGQLRNVFWADAFSRASCSYFGDVVYVDNTYISGNYEIPLVTIVGMNHHGQTTLLGCGLLAGETMDSYHWLLRTWFGLTKCLPQTIVTDRCKPLGDAITEVFPRSHHRFSLSHIMRRVPEKLGGLRKYDLLRKAFMKAVYETLKVVEFEAAWGFMVQHFGVGDNEWFCSLYEDRARWAPVYLKDTFFAGFATTRPGETLIPIFDKYAHKQTPLKEFLDKYELALQKKQKEETYADVASRNSDPELRTRCSYETQISKIYTRELFKKFQVEVEEMYSCFSTTQLHVDGPFIIFLVKERVQGESNRKEIRDFEVLYDRIAGEVRCICSCFSFYGYLCRHALCVLNFNGIEEIPLKYILPRWRKDYKRVRTVIITDHGDSSVQWFDQLSGTAMQVVEEGAVSVEHYKAALHVFQDSLDRLLCVEDKLQN